MRFSYYVSAIMYYKREIVNASIWVQWPFPHSSKHGVEFRHSTRITSRKRWKAGNRSVLALGSQVPFEAIKQLLKLFTHIVIIIIINGFHRLILGSVCWISVSFTRLDEERLLYTFETWQYEDPGVGPPSVDVIWWRLF